MIVDDRVKVWEPAAQPHTLQVCPFLPYDTAASVYEGATAAWSLQGAKAALEEGRSGFFREMQAFSDAVSRVRRAPVFSSFPSSSVNCGRSDRG